MLVSAISENRGGIYSMSSNVPSYNSRAGEPFRDTAFNSLTPYISKKNISDEKLPQVFDNINEWQNFCHKQILGGNLNVIA